MIRKPMVRILLVEDETKLARSIKEQLERAGNFVEIAQDGIDAEAKAMQGGYDIIVLDLNLPKKSGLDVLRDLRAASYETPVLILTALEGVERSEEHTSELQSLAYLVCRLLLEKKN